MTEEQSRPLANFRKIADEKMIDYSHLTDEQLLLMSEAVKRILDGFSKAFLSAWEHISQNFRVFLNIFEAEKKRQRRMYYRKKRSQSKRRA